MPSLDPRQTLGKLGEHIAARELELRGYSILATRHRTRFGEIDIVADRPAQALVSAGRREVAFVEVKARKTAKYGSAAESVTPRKRRRIAAMALDYLASTNKLECPCQFVVVAIDRIGTSKMTLRVIENAWTVDS